MKKLSSRGFTLVELMIVIAIIGILAAVLYPSMTGYFERSRDTNRQGALRNVTLSLANYQTDNSGYPTSTDSCLTNITGISNYIQQLPKDPKVNFGVAWCATGTWGGYGYARIPDSFWTANASYFIVAHMEIQSNANFTGATAWATIAGTEKMGSGRFINVNQKGTKLVTDTNSANWYYAVGQ